MAKLWLRGLATWYALQLDLRIAMKIGKFQHSFFSLTEVNGWELLLHAREESKKKPKENEKTCASRAKQSKKGIHKITDKKTHTTKCFTCTIHRSEMQEVKRKASLGFTTYS